LWTFASLLAFAGVSLAVAPYLGSEEGNASLAEAGGMWKQAVEAGIYDDTWKAGLHQLPMAMTSGLALLLFAFVAAYLFGHEFKERTMVSALTTSVRREYLVASKMVVLGAWLAALTLFMLVAHIVDLLLLGAPSGFEWSLVFGALGDSMLVTFMLYLVMPLFALLAMWGRGYLRPMLGAVVLMGMGNGLATTDISRYFPTNMPLHIYGTSWMPIAPAGLNAGSWTVLLGVFAAGLAGTIWYVDRADVA
jgi:ABC-type transport system involved in multi-copper enzyme maturation permease subunit